MNWSVEYTPEALQDIKELDPSQRAPVLRAVTKVSSDPRPQSEGGLGKPLGNKRGLNLTGLMKIKLKAHGIRVVYLLKRERHAMQIIIVSIRDNEYVYKKAKSRLE